MPQTSLGRALRYAVAVLVLSGGCVLPACTGGTGERRNVNVAVPLNADTVVAVNAAQLVQFTIPDGSVFSPGIGNNPVSMTFNSTGDSNNLLFILARFGSAEVAGGGVTFGSCTLTVTSTSFPAGRGPQTGDTLTFPTCSVLVSAGNVEVGGDTVDATLTLMLTNAAGVSAASTPLLVPSSVHIREDGILFLNNVNTRIPIPRTT